MNVELSLKNGNRVMLCADDHNWIILRLRKRNNKATGEVSEEWEPFLYFASPAQAFNRLIDMKLRTGDAQSLRELAADLAAAREEITAVWSTEIGTHLELAA